MDCYPVVSYTTEEDWDTYVNTVEQMNAGHLLEIEQAAYDRFAALKG